MTLTPAEDPTSVKQLRLWPGVVAVALQWLLRFAVPFVVPGGIAVGVIAGLAGGLVVIVWWLFFSRAPWAERVGGIVLMTVAAFAS